ncbi:hypothetical protein [Nostoc sp. WHI]|uniref:hypothetical protein n=1 Tax=Nostoc sp. WHI TaxID=2650611 RepID=UPI0018C85936|nr:hypothetical protein [Nostoc sp. WHI]MBG1271977.1 hypothetical protein [Nostoc sp. WHI]
MSIWIVTTGNSDVLLKHNKSWGSLYSEVRYDLECTEFAPPTPKDPYNKEAGYRVSARLLGIVYGNKPDKYDSDLEFTLLDTYYEYFLENNIKLERIIILLTDQTEIFKQDQIIYEKCPYWQDTCTLKPLFEWYLQRKFNCQLEFLYLAPKNGNKGIDNWNETLSLGEEEFRKLDSNPLKPVYVSHQAGTPAISSAIQFVSLGKFKNVKFLVSNEYFDENYQQKSKSEAIESSNYWRGIQIQKAKQLIIGGFPGAALKILEDIDRIDKAAIASLEKIVDFFNLHSTLMDSGQDFEITQATQRIVDALDLIGFFFNQKNYLQGITLLAAAQETFLKVAILSQVAMINKTINLLNGDTRNVSELIEWVPLGLHLSKSIKNETNTFKIDILKILKFPVEKINNNFGIINKNDSLIDWLKNIDNNFHDWPLLRWYCYKNRDANDDLRNQLMHNLRGVEEQEVISYLLGYEKYEAPDVMTTYVNSVKQPFLEAINYFKLPYKREKLNKKLQEVADSLI